jgi:mono/diheme cytochrome c family protein
MIFSGGNPMAGQGARMRARHFLSLGLIFVSLGRSGAQTKPESDQQFPKLIHSVEGPDLFQVYCASCHGLDAKGRGPIAPALKTKVADLTVLARNSGGQFPSNRVRRIISGDEVTASHGSREMPIWGPIFHQVESDRDWGNVRLENLVKYLESIQLAHPASGGELYKEHCAVCHGNDLKGTGPAPEPFRAPPDLTTLARRHGGKFPDAYVLSVLRNGATMPAHGPAQMPIWGMDLQAAERLDLTNFLKSLQAK